MKTLLRIYAVLAITFTVSSGIEDYPGFLHHSGRNSSKARKLLRTSLDNVLLLPENVLESHIIRRSHTSSLLGDKIDHNNVRKRRELGPSRIIMTHNFNGKVVSPGEDVSLQCAATSDRPPRFVWERDSVPFSPGIEPRYNLGQLMSPSGHGVESHLNISRMRVEDGGFYSCIAVEGDGRVSHAARIDVFGPPYIRTLPPIKVQSGDQLKLRCPYYGYPISKLEWEHKGHKVHSTVIPQHSRYKRSHYHQPKRKRRQIFEPNENGVLSIQKVKKEENGDSYTCVVYSPSGEMARRSFEIQVVEAPILDELRVGTVLKEGQIVQITCNIIGGDPPIYFSWLKDGKKIASNLKITEKSSELFSVIIIKKVSLEHCGRYSCIATNHIGKTNQTAELYINVAPKWIEEPSNTSLLLGQRGAVYCNANGYPAPQVHWMKRDANLGIWRPVLDLAGGGVLSLTNGTLLIEVVTLADEGLYACNVENGVGEPLSKNIWISVNKPVHFDSSTTNLTTKLGLPVMLSCQPLGDYPIQIKWFLNGQPLDLSTSRFTVSENQVHNGLKSTVNINYVESKDGGYYECRASNPYGVAIHVINLSILEPPTPPLDVQVDSIGSRSAKVTWRDTISSHVQYYSVQHHMADHYTGWDTATSINVTRQDTEVRQSVELRDLLPAVDYRVRVASGNQVDLSVYTQPVHFTTHQEAPSSPPLSVQVQQTESPGELAVSWLPPPRDTLHGAIQGYHVRAQPRGASDFDESQTKTAKVLTKNGKQETVLSGLLKNTRYAVTVSAYNAAGNGPFTLPVYQTTREGAPDSPPLSVECRGASSSSLRVSWQPITTTEASLVGYAVYYSAEEGPWSNMSTPHTEVYLQGLMKYTNFTIKIAGFSNYGLGPFSHHIVCTTLQDVPGPPAAIKVLVSSPSSLLVSWKSPEHPNGEITHYNVYVKSATSNTPPQSYRVEASQESRQLRMSVKGLSEGAQYEAAVAAATAAGEGPRAHAPAALLSNRVVAGVWSLGGEVRVGAGGSLLLTCATVGSPPPRAVWYHHHNIITHHPRFTRNHDDSLLINNIDQSLSGNYTCLAKNLYGSDSVSYTVVVLPTPEPPRIRVVAHRNALLVQWDETRTARIVYNLTWKEASSTWEEHHAKSLLLRGVSEHLVTGLRCGTKYSLRVTAANSVGTSPPAYVEAKTLGGLPIGPTTTDWFVSNATHISIQLSGWDENGCDVTSWDVRYKPAVGRHEWAVAVNEVPITEDQWSHYTLTHPSVFLIGSLEPATWYQVKVTAQNAAGTTVGYYRYATTTVLGDTIEPPTDYSDLYLSLIAGCFAVAVICLIVVVFLLKSFKGSNRSETVGNYNSVTTECNSKASDRSTDVLNGPPTVNDNRLYSTPIHIGDSKQHEMYEISPYAQFAIGFRTFGHVDNQEVPRLPPTKGRYEAETSFQLRSESEESDCVSRTTTLKSVPRKPCRVPHHHR